ncbi:hypothetical protein GSI_04217 [Ganoderma sinense ZZ0214-1]|uniref:Heterokaryon incompatibility domain-containing protein n=1 Tax=Ganoderma sinense ZZ0214-1 TaxID=1077348 RepID=A0A2G8SIJ9_9APHY|nr:hypothetical protein GSI_04217 [Ganoderma sinense ZZ0214-1]
MWLLSTGRAELRFFSAPDEVPGGYAILSHTWGANEQTFEKTQALCKKCKNTGDNPRDLSSDKVRESCILAERHGYSWLWNDTCCIDRTNPAELSEALNSRLGVQDRSELIMPSLVLFVSADWSKIFGNKVELAPVLEQVTGVSSRVLRREVHPFVVGVAERLSWASNRNTTRVEDEAYCLMGLFGISMLTIYGEGRQAFQRLQHEIMKQSFDTSLFAWGHGFKVDQQIAPERHIGQSEKTFLPYHSYLLSDSPKRFKKLFGCTVRYTPAAAAPLQPYLDGQWNRITSIGRDPAQQRTGTFGRIELPRFSATSYGVECRFPIIESDGIAVAVLLCDTGREHIGLLLRQSNDPVQDPWRKKYYIVRYQPISFPSSQRYISLVERLISLGNNLYNLRLNGKTVTAEWRDIFISDSFPSAMNYDDVGPTFCAHLHSITPVPPFRLPQWLPADEEPINVRAVFEDVDSGEIIWLVFGTCTRSPGAPSHWAKAMVDYATRPPGSRWDPPTSHDCLGHHVKDWHGWTKDFGDAARTVRLSFSPCKLDPERTLVVHVELEGPVYRAMMDQKNVTFPSREAVGLGTSAG